MKKNTSKVSLGAGVKLSIFASVMTCTSCVNTADNPITFTSNEDLKSVETTNDSLNNPNSTITKNGIKIRTPKNPTNNTNSIKTVNPANNNLNSIKNATPLNNKDLSVKKPTASSSRADVARYWKKEIYDSKVSGKIIDWQLTGPIKPGYKVFKAVESIAKSQRKEFHTVLVLIDTRYETSIKEKHTTTLFSVPFGASKQEKHKLIVDQIERIEKHNNN